MTLRHGQRRLILLTKQLLNKSRYSLTKEDFSREIAVEIGHDRYTIRNYLRLSLAMGVTEVKNGKYLLMADKIDELYERLQTE